MSNLGQLFDKPGEGWATVENIEKIQNGELTVQEAVDTFNETQLDEAKVVAASKALNRVGPSGYGKSLRYPQDHLQHDSDYVMFNFYRYTPPFKKDSSSTRYFWERGGTTEESFSAGAGNDTLSNYNQSALYSRPEFLTPIVLFMPEDVSSS